MKSFSRPQWAGLWAAVLGLTLLLQFRPGIAATFETFLEPARVVDISTPYRDRIELIHVRENDRVRQGDLLAELESRVLKSQLAQAEQAAAMHGGIDAARALVRMRKKRVAMLSKLKESGNARPQELDTAKTELLMARADLQSALENQKLKQGEARVIAAKIEEKRLTSPIDGIVVQVYKENAELTGGTDAEPLLTLAQLDPLHAIFHLPPGAAKQLEKTKKIQLNVGGREVSGRIDYISPIIDAQSGTITARIIIANPDHRLKSGERCTLILPETKGDQFNEQQGHQEPAADQGPLQ